MPLADFKCEEHGVAEMLLSRKQFEELGSGLIQVCCTECRLPMAKLLSTPAKTATLWHGNWSQGLASSGFHSTSVGGRVANKREEEKIMRARGFIPESDLGGDVFYERMTSNANEERQRLNKVADTYLDNLEKFDGDKMKAVVETFPAHEMLAQSEAV